MKHFLILSVLLFCSQLTTSAKLRELDQMIEIANRILNEHDSSSSKRLSAERCESSMQKMYETSEICVIGYAAGGFAVVSKDDRFEECLGYSKSSFDVDNVSPEFEWLMQELTNKMSEESSFASKSRKTTEESPAMSIEPLITTQWDQREPYNKLLPEYKGDRCVAGCLATALAQVLYYYKSPTKGKGEMSYTWKINGEEQSVYLNFNDLTFDYDRMLSDYKHGYTDEEANAVAELYLACGVACSTRYTPGQSSAGIAPVSIYKHLSTYIENVTRESSAIINALEHGNPVLCSGNNGQDGHMMIIDGYDAEKGLFHVNFGWGGMSDGYYALDIINGFVPSYCYIVRGLNTTTIENARYITSPYWEGAVFYDFDSQESAERFNVIIPDTITVDGMCYNVNQISTIAFDEKRNINFIRLPEGLTEIPSGGFADCDFKSIYLPTALKSIKYLGFMNTDADDYYCNAVVPPVDEGAFNYAQLYHATLHVPAELLDAYKDAWGNIRNGVGYRFTIKPMAPADEPMTNVCDDAEIGGIHYRLANTLITNSCQAVVLANPDFSGDIVIPSSVSYNGESYNVGQIAEAAFMDCKELTSVVLPDGLTEIKENTFRNCTK